MSNISNLYGLRTVSAHQPTKLVKDTTLSPNVLIKSEQIVGIEVEVENTRITSVTLDKSWTVTDDGSLRNQGTEFVSKPLRACDVPFALCHLFNQYLTNECHYSPRTSVHVHLNAQDMSLGQVQAFIGLYVIFERGFYKFVGRNRRANIYCVPLAECRLLTAISSGDPARNWFKYTGVNLMPLQTQGTIEFRHMHGTPDVEKITRWIGIITKLKDYVMSHDCDELLNMLRELTDKTDTHELARAVFEEWADYLPLNPEYNDVAIAKQVFSTQATFNENIKGLSKASPFFTFKG